jgi:hypothetical protein
MKVKSKPVVSLNFNLKSSQVYKGEVEIKTTEESVDPNQVIDKNFDTLREIMDLDKATTIQDDES